MNGDKPAFPEVEDYRDAYSNQHIRSIGGLTKREYFAAMAMQWMESNPDRTREGATISDIAEFAVAASDALLKALEDNES